jgi:hypothetical protein
VSGDYGWHDAPSGQSCLWMTARGTFNISLITSHKLFTAKCHIS